MHSLREAQATPHLSEWDRWAAAEYRRLTEDEGEEDALMSHGEMEGLDELDEHELRVWGARQGFGSSGAFESPF